MDKPKIKVCGLTTYDTVQTAIECGANYLGFVFAPKSPRNITIEDFIKLSASIPKEIPKVAVCQNPKIEWIEKLIHTGQINIIQIHGELPENFDANAYDVKCWRAYQSDKNQIIHDAQFSAVVLDGAKSGSGELGSWKNYALVPYQQKFIAGGLHQNNIQTILETIRPYGIDLSSGLEMERGVKSCEKIRSFFNKIKEITS